jgi:hypothetical protein
MKSELDETPGKILESINYSDGVLDVNPKIKI